MRKEDGMWLGGLIGDALGLSPTMSPACARIGSFICGAVGPFEKFVVVTRSSKAT
jgi:hypothetical protein